MVAEAKGDLSIFFLRKLKHKKGTRHSYFHSKRAAEHRVDRTQNWLCRMGSNTMNLSSRTYHKDMKDRVVENPWKMILSYQSQRWQSLLFTLGGLLAVVLK